MKTLIIDNNIMKDSWGAPDLVAYALQTPGNAVIVRRGPEEDLPPSVVGWDRVIISGSITSATDQAPWVLKLDAWIRAAVGQSVPLLGVCYGHQSICRALGGPGTVRKGAQPEYGWTRIQVLKAAPLFTGLPPVFFSYSSHQDEVASLPPGFSLLASSKRCVNQAFRMDGKPVFGVQFHPERSLEAGEAALKKRRAEGKEILEEGRGSEVFQPEVAATIFGTFLRGEWQ